MLMRIFVEQEGPNANGALYIENALNRSVKALDENKGISKQLLPIVKRTLEIVKGVQSAEANNNEALKKYWADLDALFSDVNVIVMQCNLILQQPAMQVTALATPRNVIPETSSAAVSLLRPASHARDLIFRCFFRLWQSRPQDA